MVEKRLGKLLHGGESAGDDQRRRSGRFSSGILEPAMAVDSSWVGGIMVGLMGPTPRPTIFSQNREAVVLVARAVVPLSDTNRYLRR